MSKSSLILALLALREPCCLQARLTASPEAEVQSVEADLAKVRGELERLKVLPHTFFLAA